MANDADWLFMLYLSGDNNLSAEMIWALNEIEAQGLPDRFRNDDSVRPCHRCPQLCIHLRGTSVGGDR